MKRNCTNLSPLEKLGFAKPARRTRAQNQRDTALYKLGFANSKPTLEAGDEEGQDVVVNQADEPDESVTFDRGALEEMKKLLGSVSVRLDGLSRTLDDSLKRGRESVEQGRAALANLRRR